jgi:2,3-bisphosphoglycerate-dependent phosphoglycerate mutase
MTKLVIIRHGESLWNKENIFAGWVDVPLTEKGIMEAKKAGAVLKEKGLSFDLGFTSVLKRASDTLNLILKEMNLDIPVEKSWRLNERHYGWLQGKNRDEMRKKFGCEQVEKWRRGYEVKPPTKDKAVYKYEEVGGENIPSTESLKDTEERLMPYWNEKIAPEIKKGKRVIISAHGNSIRALIKNIEGLSGDEIVKVEIPIGIPLVYELNDDLKPVDKYYLHG